MYSVRSDARYEHRANLLPHRRRRSSSGGRIDDRRIVGEVQDLANRSAEKGSNRRSPIPGIVATVVGTLHDSVAPQSALAMEIAGAGEDFRGVDRTHGDTTRLQRGPRRDIADRP